MDDDKQVYFLRGRAFSNADIEIIKTVIEKDYSLGRTSISKTVCEKLGWRQPNGWLKDRACRDVLVKLEEIGVISLPPSKARKMRSVEKEKKAKEEIHINQKILNGFDITSPIQEYPSEIDFIFAKGNDYELIWNLIVSKYHYLGHRVLVGRSIKYLIVSGNRVIGAISYSSPSWALESREILLSKLGIKNPHDYTINNSRFLILPDIKIKNLASSILSISVKKIVRDWEKYYSITPVIAETFVQPSLYYGTCYKAANWIEIGVTKGFAKRGSSYHNSQEPKTIFVYGLNRKIRRKIAEMVSENQNE